MSFVLYLAASLIAIAMTKSDVGNDGKFTCPVTDCPPGIRVNNTYTPWKCWLDWLKQEATE